MADKRFPHDEFDLKLAVECANAYSGFSGLGCTVTGVNGEVLHEAGYGCASCEVCDASGLDKDNCIRTHIYGMTEAERFGGKYIYFCPMGLTCFVSPIMGSAETVAKITVGPFFMVDREDYIDFDLRQKLGLDEKVLQRVLDAAEELPYIPSGKVNSLSILLFMAVGFMNNVSAANRMLETQDSDAIQGRITEYIMELKSGEAPPDYPFKTEKALISSIADSDKHEAQKLLNELLGHILFSSGGDFGRIKSRVYELLVIVSRAAMDAGVSAEQTFNMNHDFFRKAAPISNIDELCMMLAEIMNRYIDSIFEFSDVKNTDVIYKAVHYMRKNYTRKVTLEEVAKAAFLSPTYFSKIFKQEMGCSFNTYLNRLRVDKSKQLLLQSDLQLVDIANALGFEDQSYFTKVFKRITGESPNQFRKTGS